MKKLLFLLITIFTIQNISAREIHNLNRDWKFTYGWEVRAGISSPVNIPHTWNRDALSGKADYYRGLANYEKSITIPNEWKGKKLFLRFEGVANIANVFVNGKHLQEHRGGYTAFNVDITDNVKFGEENTLMVRVNNAPTLDIMPLLGDFNMYGGIYRDVNLIVTEPTHISLSDYGSNGIYLSQESSEKSAKISAKVLVESPELEKSKVSIEIYDAKAKLVAKSSTTPVTNDKEPATALLNLEVKHPNLWMGTKSPYLYSAKVIIENNGTITDSITQKIGFRYYEVDPVKGFMLNGEHYKIHGVCRHQDRPEIGNALHKTHHEQDMEIMREMGVNAIRLSHYPQDKYFYELCDKYGIVVWTEIPFVGPGGYRDKGFVDQQSFKDNGKQQLKELIRQNYNHASVLFWGLFNELKEYGDNPCDYVRELNILAHSEDPTRITTAASNQEGQLNKITDIIAWNIYFGWYGQEASYTGEWADTKHKDYANKAIGISEYGAGASIHHQSEELKKPVANSYFHPENWQTHYHEQYWRAISPRDFIWGSFVWNMFDFGAAHRTEGEISGINDKGLVTFDRSVKKDAFYFYKANWNTSDKFVYIAERRLTTRTNENQTFKVYSNCSNLELFVNGKSVGTNNSPDFGTYTWKNIKLQKGENKIKVVSLENKETDQIIIKY